MNARNLQYIKKFNPAKAIRLANDKIKSKKFLDERWIPVPKAFGVINNRSELYDFNFSALPAKEFIAKPSNGSRWRGIYRIKPIETPEWSHYRNNSAFDAVFTKQSPYIDQRYEVWSEVIPDQMLRRYLVDVLDGKSSMNRWNDKILLEEFINPGSWFELYCEHGLADIRVIVFNLVPVAAMLRVPTIESDGKANLDRWGIGLGVNVSTGKVISMYQHGEIYKTNFPNGYENMFGKKIPYWNDILSYSSKVQYFANLWYLALDRVITDEWPKLLEINARAWLKFQLAAVLPLRKRLDKIKDMNVSDPEKGVEIAKTLFTWDKWHLISSSKVIYLSQHGKLKKTLPDWGRESMDVIVDVDIKRQRTTVGSQVKEFLWEELNTYMLELADSHITFHDFTIKWAKKIEDNTIILWRDLAQEYYIKPIKKIFTTEHIISDKNLIEHEVDKLHILDEKLFKIWRVLNLSRILKPTNYLEQLDNFITRNGHYNPKFTYNRPSDKKLHSLHNQLLRLRERYFDVSTGLQSPFSHLFSDKIIELQCKHDLIVAYKKQDFNAVLKLNKKMFGILDPHLIKQSKRMIFEHQNVETGMGRTLRSLEIKEYILSYLKQEWFEWVQVYFDGQTTARLTVARTSKSINIKIKQWAIFKEKDLKATLAHEIDIHVKRWVNGTTTWWHILRNGTAWFLTDEEWLAIYTGNKLLSDDYVKKWTYFKYYMLSIAWEKDFSYLAWLLRSLRWASLRQSFNGTLRIKKWVKDTSTIQSGALYYGWKVYLDGHEKITSWIEAWGNVDDLMIGKIKIDDLKYL